MSACEPEGVCERRREREREGVCVNVRESEGVGCTAKDLGPTLQTTRRTVWSNNPRDQCRVRSL